MLRLFFALFILIPALPRAAAADTTPITKDMVAAQYEKLERALNDRHNAVETIKFLHAYFTDDARFKVTVSNPDLPGAAKSPVMELNKQDYINTYIQGTHFVADYEMDIQTLKFEASAAQAEAYTLDVMTERGMMMNELNDGKPFVSRTTCRTRHEIREGRLRAAASECHTDISFEEEV